eukprot:TRINITY_DN9940_c0_g4_i1.p1 TRINITY_DN9940_c0_g4~~TRINITY_DN9940_c0_g4_i1.p1  ORF type:complete len:995 (+),score=260.88 TRINITY_DN9940_c0_g4_i1:76-2985(+)
MAAGGPSEVEGFKLKVSYSGQRGVLELPQSATVGELRQRIAEHTGVLPQHQRLLLKGQGAALAGAADGSPLGALGVPADAHVMVVGAKAEEVAEAAAAAAPPAPPPAPPSVMMSAEATRKRKLEGPRASSYIGRIDVLPYPRMAEARALLTRIASDAGIVGVLENRKWRIGALMELDPTRIKLAGLNENRGERILLRLRHPPPEHESFLPYSEIRDTMLHELTHCVHGPHDEKFWALFRELCKECRAKDWRGGGQRLGGARVLNPTPFADPDELPWWEATSARRLGGARAAPAAGPQEAAALSAFARAAQQQGQPPQGAAPSQAPPEGDGGSSDSGGEADGLPPVGAAVTVAADRGRLRAAAEARGLDAAEAAAVEACAGRRGWVVRRTRRGGAVLKLHVDLPGGGEVSVVLPAELCGPDAPQQSEPTAAAPPSPAALPQQGAVAQPQPPASATAEEGALAAAVQELAALPQAQLELTNAPRLLTTLVRNIVSHPEDPRFRSVRRSVPQVTAAIAVPCVRRILATIGFREEGERLIADGAEAAALAASALRLLLERFPSLCRFALRRTAAADGALVRQICGIPCGGGGEGVAAACGDGCLRVWAPAAPDPALLLGHSAPLTACCPAAPGMVASAARDGRVIVWDAGSGAPQRVSAGDAQVRALAPAPHTSGDVGAVLCGDAQGAVRLLSDSAAANGPPLADVGAADGGVTAVAALADGGVAAAAGQRLRWWDAAGVERGQWQGDAIIRALCALPGPAAACASGGNDGMLRLWDSRGGSVASATVGGGYVLAIACQDSPACPLGPLVVTASADGTVTFRSVPGLLCTQTVKLPRDAVGLCALSSGAVAAATESAVYWFEPTVEDVAPHTTVPAAPPSPAAPPQPQQQPGADSVAELVAMGFPADQAAQALAAAGGDVSRAAEALAADARRAGLVGELLAMGFPEPEARAALEATGWGSVQRAADRLLSQG